jgi:hypothetical protein
MKDTIEKAKVIAWINEKIEIVCESERTRYGFRHLAYLMFNGIEQDKAKCCYYNRTWESFEFQSVAKELIRKTKCLSEEERKFCNEWLDGDRTDWSGFKTISAFAKLGELFCDNQKDKNDWKARMLKAGLENKGFEMPEDWNTLDEDTKQVRLNAVIGVLDSK